jgi:hypothetical protein
MPYIKQHRRKKYDIFIEGITQKFEEDADTSTSVLGDLSYVIYSLIDRWIRAGKRVDFETLIKATGAAQAAVHEYKRRKIGPYEDMKRTENGDI